MARPVSASRSSRWTRTSRTSTSPTCGPTGRDRRLLTSQPGVRHRPGVLTATAARSRSPAGVAHRSGSEGDPAYSETYVMKADGSHVRRITNNVGLRRLAPSWSPNGRSLVLGRGIRARRARPTCGSSISPPGRERRLTDSPGTTRCPRTGLRTDVASSFVRRPGRARQLLTSTPSGPTALGFAGSRQPGFRRGRPLLPGRRVDRVRLRPHRQRRGVRDATDGSGVRRVTRDPAFDAIRSSPRRPLHRVRQRAGRRRERRLQDACGRDHACGT